MEVSKFKKNLQLVYGAYNTTWFGNFDSESCFRKRIAALFWSNCCNFEIKLCGPPKRVFAEHTKVVSRTCHGQSEMTISASVCLKLLMWNRINGKLVEPFKKQTKLWDVSFTFSQKNFLESLQDALRYL